MAAVELTGVSKTFPSRRGDVTALSGVDLSVARSSFVSIVGASGCGKSTLLNLVAGFEMPSRGRVLVEGRPVVRPGPDRGVIFQQTALFPWLSVRENIAFGLRLRANRDKGPIDARVDEMLRRVGLEAFKDRHPIELSGGMRQRAAIASVLAIRPSILLMDEPFGALDALTRSLMQDFLLEILTDDPNTVLLVTHDIDEAIYLADRAVIMTAHPGRVHEIIDIDLGRPRRYEMRSTPRFIELRDHVTAIVRNEASAAVAAEVG